MLIPAFASLIFVSGAGPTDFEIRTTADAPQAAEIQSVGADGAINLTSGKTVPAGEWYSLRRSPGILPAWPRGPLVELGIGDKVAGTVASADGDAIRLQVTFPGRTAQPLRFPLSAVRVAWLTSRPESDGPDWLAGPRKRDVIQSKDGDVARGALTGIDAAHNMLRYNADGKDHVLDLSKVAAVAFNTDLARVRRPKGPYYRLTLADGTRLSATTVTFDGNSWSVQSAFKETLKVPGDQVISVDVEQGKPVSLSDIKPAKYEYQSFEGEQYTWVADRCVNGQALRLKTSQGESTYDRGVGLHADCTVTYALGGKYRWFEALAGLDARAGVRGDAVLTVLVDGKARDLPAGGHLTPAGAPLAVRIDVTGAEKLTITVRHGKGGNVQDCVNLAEARFVP